jgi:GAF domain-containing protein
MFRSFQEVFEQLITPRYRYGDGDDMVRARVTIFFSLLVLLSSGISLISLILSTTPTQDTLPALFITFIGMALSFSVYAMANNGQVRLASLVLAALLSANVFTLLYFFDGDPFAFGLLVPTIIYLAAVTTWVYPLLVGVAGFMGIIFVTRLGLTGQLPSLEISQGSLGGRAAVMVSVIFLSTIISVALSLELRRLTKTGSRLSGQVRAINELAILVTGANNRKDLLDKISESVLNRHALYEVQIFLVDRDRRYADLIASKGVVGDKALEYGQRIAINSTNLISRVIQRGEVIASQDDSVYRPARSELLREAQSEVAFPLTIGENVIGVLAVYSKQRRIESAVIENINTLTPQITMAIHTFNQMEEHRVAANENYRLMLEAEVTLREARKSNLQLTEQAWEGYLKSRGKSLIAYSASLDSTGRGQGGKINPQVEEGWSRASQEAVLMRRVSISTQDDVTTIALPIDLRGKAIGALEIQLRGPVRQVEVIGVMKSIAERLALSIDGARMFEHAQELAQRELEINRISEAMQNVSDIESMVRVAIGALGKALGTQDAKIRIGLPDNDAFEMNPNLRGATNPSLMAGDQG